MRPHQGGVGSHVTPGARREGRFPLAGPRLGTHMSGRGLRRVNGCQPSARLSAARPYNEGRGIIAEALAVKPDDVGIGVFHQG